MARVLIYYTLDGKRQPPREFKSPSILDACREANAWCRERTVLDAQFQFIGAGAEQGGPASAEA